MLILFLYILTVNVSWNGTSFWRCFYGQKVQGMSMRAKAKFNDSQFKIEHGIYLDTIIQTSAYLRKCVLVTIIIARRLVHIVEINFYIRGME